MKTLAKFGCVLALVLGSASFASATEEDPALKAQMDSLQKWGAACMQAQGAQIIPVCQSSLDSVIKLQPSIQYVSQLMMSFMVETHARSNLSNAYFKQENIGKHCEHAEKALLTKLYASKYETHDFYPPIKQIADSHILDVKTCRTIAGKPEWGADL